MYDATTLGARSQEKAYGAYSAADESPVDEVDADQLYAKASQSQNAEERIHGPALTLDGYPGFSDE